MTDERVDLIVDYALNVIKGLPPNVKSDILNEAMDRLSDVEFEIYETAEGEDEDEEDDEEAG